MQPLPENQRPSFQDAQIRKDLQFKPFDNLFSNVCNLIKRHFPTIIDTTVPHIRTKEGTTIYITKSKMNQLTAKCNDDQTPVSAILSHMRRNTPKFQRTAEQIANNPAILMKETDQTMLFKFKNALESYGGGYSFNYTSHNQMDENVFYFSLKLPPRDKHEPSWITTLRQKRDNHLQTVLNGTTEKDISNSSPIGSIQVVEGIQSNNLTITIRNNTNLQYEHYILDEDSLQKKFGTNSETPLAVQRQQYLSELLDSRVFAKNIPIFPISDITSDDIEELVTIGQYANISQADAENAVKNKFPGYCVFHGDPSDKQKMWITFKDEKNEIQTISVNFKKFLPNKPIKPSTKQYQLEQTASQAIHTQIKKYFPHVNTIRVDVDPKLDYQNLPELSQKAAEGILKNLRGGFILYTNKKETYLSLVNPSRQIITRQLTEADKQDDEIIRKTYYSGVENSKKPYDLQNF